MNDSDLELLRRYVDADDRGALDTLFARHYPAVYRTALKLVRDEFDANDVAQATFLAAVRAGRSAMPERSFRAWLLAIAVNEVRQLARRQRRRRDEAIVEAVVADPAGSAAEVAGRREFERVLDDELRHLPPRLAEPLVLHYYESLPFAEVAGILGLPKSTVQTRITQAVVRLRRAFRRSCRAALLPFLDLPSLTATSPPWLAILAMNGKQLGIGLVGCLALALGWFSIGLVSRSGPPEPIAAEREAGSLASDADVTAPGVPAAEPQRTAPPAVDAAAEALVFGRVVDADSGAPVAAASVTLFDFETSDLELFETDAQGRYAFPSTRGRTGLFRLTIDKRDAGRLVVPEVRPAIEPRQDELRAGLVLHGRVRLATGAAPPPGCRILAVRQQFRSYADREVIAALWRQRLPHGLCIDREADVAPADGAFRLPDLQAGSHALVVVAPDRAPVVCPAEAGNPFAGFEAAPESQVQPIEIVLPAIGSLFVEVVDGSSAMPVAGANVTVGAAAAGLWLPLATAAADPAAPNRFRVPVDLDAAGRVANAEVRVRAPGRAPVHFRISGQHDGEALVVALRRHATVLGSVRDHDGAPVAGASVLIRLDSNHRLAGSARTDAAGAFEIGGLGAADGPMTLLCLESDGRRLRTTVPLVLAEGEVRRVDIGPGAAGSFTGRVAVAGVPRSGVYVCLYGRHSTIDVRCHTGDDGRFAFDALPPDTYELFLNIPAGARSLYATRDVIVDTAPVHLELDFAHRLTGVVRFEGLEPGTPPPEGDIVAARLHAPGVTDQVQLDADGAFELFVTEPATHEITFEAGVGWVTLDPPQVDLRLGTPPPLVLRVLRDPCDATIELRLRDAVDGTPAAGFLNIDHRNSHGGAVFEDGIHLEEETGIGVHRFTIQSHAHRPTRVEVEVLPGQKHVVRDVLLERAEGVRVTEVEAGAPAHRAGLREGDRILRYGEHPVRSIAQLRECIAASTGIVTLVVQRDGVELPLLVDAGPLGIRLENLP